MGGDRDAVLRTLGGFRKREGLARRADYKGYRHRLNLRVPAELSQDLQIIKTVTGEAKNGFCERVLKEAISEKVEELRQQHDAAAWEAIARCAAKAGG